jgi:hypothetical protein
MATPSVGHTLNHDGGHNMEMYPKYDGADNVAANINTNGCVDCHTAGDAFTNQIETTQHGVEELLTELKTALMDNGILSSSGRLVPGKYPVGVAGAYWNYDLIEMDASLGVHNADYSRQLLTSTINYMNSLK